MAPSVAIGIGLALGTGAIIAADKCLDPIHYEQGCIYSVAIAAIAIVGYVWGSFVAMAALTGSLVANAFSAQESSPFTSKLAKQMVFIAIFAAMGVYLA